MFDLLFRQLPIFKGKQRLARFILKNKIDNSRDIWIKGRYGCKYFLPNLLENISFEIFVNGIFEREVSDFFAINLPENATIMDLGANIGTISIPLIRRRNDIKVICVEAAPWIFRYLEKNLAGNTMKNAIAVNKVLFYTDNDNVNFYSPVDKFGKGSLSPVFTNDAVKVKTIKVDSLVKEFGLSHVDMIKIDVEGYEYHVFKGATELLSREDAPDILFEFVDWAEEKAKGIEIGASQEILMKMGYSIYHFHESKHRMKKLENPVKDGFHMLFATKRPLE